MAPERREALLRTAAGEFARAGFEQASLNRIIKVCGMSKSSFYYYVDSKEALFDLVVTEAGAAMVTTMDIPTPDELADSPDFWARIAQFLDQLVSPGDRAQWFEDFGRLFHLADAPSRTGALAQTLTRMYAWLDAVLAIGRSRSAVRDDLPAALQARLVIAVLSAMDDWSLTQSADLDLAGRQRLAATQLDTLRRILDPAR